MGWQYTTPSSDIISPPKGGKGVLKFRTPLLRKDTAPSIPTGMSRNTTYPPWSKPFLPHYCTKQRDALKRGIPLRIIFEFDFTPHFYQNTSSNSFCPSSLAYSFRISGTRNRAKESTMDCGSSMSYCPWCFSWLAMVNYSRGKTFLAQLSSVHTPFQPCTDTDLQPAAQQGDKPFVDLQTFS